jgi:threonine dehydratase
MSSERRGGRWVAGVDGCPAGWVVAFAGVVKRQVRIRVYSTFEAILFAPERPEVIAIDVPIGLPDFIRRSGRGPERAVRPLLGRRKPSVFSVPSRRAVGVRIQFGESSAAAHQRACIVARSTSDPQRRVSIQSFMIFPKIREVDAVLRRRRRVPVFETHPELGFCLLNGRQPLEYSKNLADGQKERRRILMAAGLLADDSLVRAPRGAQMDDVLDAIVCAATAKRILLGAALSFPDPPKRDSLGLPIAIWA